MSSVLAEIASQFHKITKGKFSSIKTGQVTKVTDAEWLKTLTGSEQTPVVSVSIQNLPLKEPIAQNQPQFDSDWWVALSKQLDAKREESDQMSRQFNHSGKHPPEIVTKDPRDKCLFFQSKIKANRESHFGGFFESLYQAYSNHGEVVLSPDDVWTMIQLSFTRYVNQGSNAETLRSKFVSHQGRKTLEVWDPASWNDFVGQILPLIKQSTNSGVLNDVMPTFSTTTDFEKFVSSVIVMDTFKAYFEYSFEISCGITKVHFLGTLEDWQSLPIKLKVLRKYSIREGDEWTQYVDRLVPVLEQFVQTYQGHVNVDWWQQVICEEHEVGYGFKSASLTGWATDFVIGAHGIKYVSDVPNLVAQVPVKVCGSMTDLWCGFSGLQVYKGRVYRPQVSVAVLGMGSAPNNRVKCVKN